MMTEIIERTIYEVNGQTFDTRAAAEDFVREQRAIDTFSCFICQESNFCQADVNNFACFLAGNWNRLKQFVDG